MSVQVQGLDALYRKLGAVASTQVLVKPMGRGVLTLQRRMQEYPPSLPAVQGPTRAGASRKSIARFRQPYKRTGTYGRRWTIKITASGNGLIGTVGNNTPYGPLVGSAQFQARIHQGRWNTDDKVIKEEAPGILDDFQASIDQALAG